MKKKIFAIFLALRSLTLFVRCSKKAPEKGIFLKVNGDGVYRISIGTDSFESNIINADSSVIKKGEQIELVADTSEILKDSAKTEYAVSVYDTNGDLICKKYFVLTKDDALVIHELNGDELSGGKESDKNGELTVNCVFLDDSEESEAVLSKAVILNENNEDYSQCVCVNISQKVKNFEYYSLVCDVEDNGDIKVIEKTLLAAAEKVPQMKNVVFYGELGETLPTKGFSFTTADGNTHNYYVMLSGKDGSAVLTEYK